MQPKKKPASVNSAGNIKTDPDHNMLPADWQQELITLAALNDAGIAADLTTMTPAECAGVYRFLKRTFPGVAA